MLNVSTTKITIEDETRECLSRQMVLVLCKYQITAVIMSWMARPKCHLFFFFWCVMDTAVHCEKVDTSVIVNSWALTSQCQLLGSSDYWMANLTPAYIADDIQLVTDSDRRQLRSATARTCFIPQTHDNFCDRSFSVAAGTYGTVYHHIYDKT